MGGAGIRVLLGCGNSQAITPAGPAVRTSQPVQAASGTTPSPLDQCVAAVDQLLVQDLNAIDQGYSGIDLSQVMAQYGATSPVFEVYSQLQGVLTENVYQSGAASALAPTERQTKPMCETYGA